MITLIPSTIPAQTDVDQSPERTVEQAIEDCVNSSNPEDWESSPITLEQACTVKAWSTLGREYPSLADKFLTLQDDFNEKTGRLNEARQSRDRALKRAEQFAMRIGKLEQQDKSQTARWKVYVGTAVGLTVGMLTGYGLSKLVP